MALTNSAHNFKPNKYSLTKFRINLILKYFIHCFLMMQKEGKKYDYKARGKVKKEDYLRDGLVDDYLNKTPNKKYFKEYISDNPNVEIFFQMEEKQNYLEQNTLAEDFIDITVKETKLSEILIDRTSDEIKFAIECKRINKSQSYSEYVKDINKLTNRQYKTYRLPYEGQIAFIENSSLNYITISKNINEKLESHKSIITVQFLKSKSFDSQFEGGYHSIHRRNYGNQNNFSIYHLMFDYSKIVIN